MNCILVTTIGFLLAFEASIVVLACAGAVSPHSGGFRAALSGRRALELPVAMGLLTALGISLPNILAVTRSHHATWDVDTARAGQLSMGLIAVLLLLATRFLFRVGLEWVTTTRLTLASMDRLPSSLARKHLRAVSATRTLLNRRGLRVRFRVLVHRDDHFPGPLVRGFARPSIMVHERLLESLRHDQLVAVFLHEAGHIYHFDHLFSWFFSLLVTPFAPNRWSRGALARWSVTCERRSDQFAATLLGSSVAVAEAILVVSRLARGGKRGAVDRVQYLLVRGQAPPGEGLPASGGIPLLRPACLGLAGALLLAAHATPQMGLGLHCLLEHVVGVHC